MLCYYSCLSFQVTVDIPAGGISSVNILWLLVARIQNLSVCVSCLRSMSLHCFKIEKQWSDMVIGSRNRKKITGGSAYHIMTMLGTSLIFCYSHHNVEMTSVTNERVLI